MLLVGHWRAFCRLLRAVPGWTTRKLSSTMSSVCAKAARSVSALEWYRDSVAAAEASGLGAEGAMGFAFGEV